MAKDLLSGEVQPELPSLALPITSSHMQSDQPQFNLVPEVDSTDSNNRCPTTNQPPQSVPNPTAMTIPLVLPVQTPDAPLAMQPRLSIPDDTNHKQVHTEQPSSLSTTPDGSADMQAPDGRPASTQPPLSVPNVDDTNPHALPAPLHTCTEQPPQPTTPNSSADTQSTGIEGCPVTTQPSLSVSAADDASSPESNQPQPEHDTENSLAGLSKGKFLHSLSSLYA